MGKYGRRPDIGTMYDELTLNFSELIVNRLGMSYPHPWLWRYARLAAP